MKLSPEFIYNTHLIKSEDLNHHGSLFAGRTAEWFVESGFVSVASIVDPHRIVCLKIHGMFFTKPVKLGEILQFSSKVVYAGKTSFISYIKVNKINSPETIVDGFITFIHVDENTKPSSHNIEIEPITNKDIELYDIAKSLKNK